MVSDASVRLSSSFGAGGGVAAAVDSGAGFGSGREAEGGAGATDLAQAVVEAARSPLRPIVLTTATTVGGLIPLWLGGGALFEAMAVAIIFGLLLFYVPVKLLGDAVQNSDLPLWIAYPIYFLLGAVSVVAVSLKNKRLDR